MGESNNIKAISTSKKVENNKEEVYQSFAEYVKAKRKMLADKSCEEVMSTRELATSLGISYEMFRKVLNLNKPTKHRDCIIAICLVVGMNAEETNIALNKYPNMYMLNEADDRDKLFIEMLEKNSRDVQPYRRVTIEEINTELYNNGFTNLDIIHHRKAVASKEKSKKKINIDNFFTDTTISTDILFGDQYGSLATQYSRDRLCCKSHMVIKDVKKRKVHRLSVVNNFNSSTGLEFHKEDQLCCYNSLQETGVFKIFFVELSRLVKTETNRLLSILNDTKNYIERISAKIKNDSLCVFAETFNYEVPEYSEYYFYESIGSNVSLLVYEKSEFMHRYMSDQDYKNTYLKYDNKVLKCYSSFEALEKEIETTKIEQKMLLQIRLHSFRHLRELSESLKDDLANRKEFIRRLDYIYDDCDRVCEFFKVEKEFECKFDGENMIASVDAVEFVLPDGDRINISLQDLYDAFELGFNDIQEVCRVKKKIGSIKGILY